MSSDLKPQNEPAPLHTFKPTDDPTSKMDCAITEEHPDEYKNLVEIAKHCASEIDSFEMLVQRGSLRKTQSDTTTLSRKRQLRKCLSEGTIKKRKVGMRRETESTGT